MFEPWTAPRSYFERLPPEADLRQHEQLLYPKDRLFEGLIVGTAFESLRTNGPTTLKTSYAKDS